MAHTIHMSLLRGICQIPAYVAYGKGLFAKAGIEAKLELVATAWMVPEKLARGATDFGVIPWTRVAGGVHGESPLVVVAGSGREEAAMVVRRGADPSRVKKLAVPVEGGMKDLTGMGLLEPLGWGGVEILRLPSGDAAILALVGEAVDAAVMVEPFATMVEQLGLGTIIKGTGDLWRGAPGCSLTTSMQLKEEAPEVIQAVVEAFVEGARLVEKESEECARIAASFIGVAPRFVRVALERNRPDVHAVRNAEAISRILGLMKKLGYLKKEPSGFIDLTFLDTAFKKTLSRRRWTEAS